MQLHLPKFSFRGASLRKLLAVALILAIVAFEFSFVPILVNKEAVKDNLVASFKALTGYDIEIQGDAVLRSFPVPHVLINSLVVRNPTGASTPFLMTVRLIDIHPSLSAMLHGKLAIDHIDINEVNAELEHMKNGGYNWLDPSILAPVDSKRAVKTLFFETPSVKVTSGYIHYTDVSNGSESEYKNLSLDVTNDAQKKTLLSAAFERAGRRITVEGWIEDIADAMTKGPQTSRLSVKSGKSEISYEGKLGLTAENWDVSGNVKMAIEDMVPWISIINDRPDDVSTSQNVTPVALRAHGEIKTDQGKILLPHFVMEEGGIAKGTLQVAMSAPFHVELSGTVDNFDLDSLFGSGFFAGKYVQKKDADDIAFTTPPKTLLDLVQMHTTLKINDAVYNKQHVTDSHIEFDLNEGEMTISQAAALLPGTSRVIFTGIGKEGYQGFALEGEVDATGDDFYKMMQIFKSQGVTLPPEDFGRFKVKANAVLSGHDLRLSEIRTRIENMGIVGGIIATFGSRTRIQAALQIGGINLDHFTSLWGLSEWRNSFADKGPGPKKDSYLSQWLHHLEYDLSLNALLNQYTFNKKLRDRTLFKMVATTNKLVMSDVETEYNGTRLAGNFSLDVSEALPRVELSAAADNINVAAFLDIPPGSIPATAIFSDKPGEPWSRQGFNFQWLELLNAKFHLKCGHIDYNGWQLENFDTRGSIQDRIMDLDQLDAITLGARMGGRATLTGEKIPRFSLALNVVSLAAEQVAAYLPALRGMSGKFNVTFVADTSGANMLSWITNLSGHAGVGGNNVTVQGFNLPGIINAVSYVRTVADILNVVKRAFPGGDTSFSQIDGQWTVGSGEVRAPNTRLVSKDASGLMAGKIDLVNLTTQGRITFDLTSLDRVNTPSMTINFTGKIGAPEKSLDTRSLEQYVTNETSKRMLQHYGTQ